MLLYPMKSGAVFVITLLVVVLFFGFINFTGKVVTSINTCTDTDIGQDFFIKGQVSGIEYPYNKQSFVEEDKCLNAAVLLEKYCVTDGISSYRSSIKYICDQGCYEGRCLGEQKIVEHLAPKCKVLWWCQFKKFLASLE